MHAWRMAEAPLTHFNFLTTCSHQGILSFHSTLLASHTGNHYIEDFGKIHNITSHSGKSWESDIDQYEQSRKSAILLNGKFWIKSSQAEVQKKVHKFLPNYNFNL